MRICLDWSYFDAVPCVGVLFEVFSLLNTYFAAGKSEDLGSIVWAVSVLWFSVKKIRHSRF